jgi:hypothetical protein
MSKRYVLFKSNVDLTQTDFEAIREFLEAMNGSAKVIPVKGNARAVIVRTSNAVAPLLRGEKSILELGEKKLVSVLTSGAIGNLKRRATETPANGKIP